jgi:hypothetical protein
MKKRLVYFAGKSPLNTGFLMVVAVESATDAERNLMRATGRPRPL